MKAMVADLRNNFATLSRWVHGGEAIVSTKRGIPFASVSPVKCRKKVAQSVDRMSRFIEPLPDGRLKGYMRTISFIERGDR